MYETKHPAYSALARVGQEITTQVLPQVPGGAKAVVVLSAHWQGGRNNVLVNVGEDEKLIYDFYGFPDHYYKETFPNRGSKETAEQIIALLREAGISVEGTKRGLDHGVWAGFKCMFDPTKNPLNIPIVQVSIFDNEDPYSHHALGKALSSLREQGYVIICSGMAVHNLRDLFKPGGNKTMDYALTFDEALKQAVTGTEPGEGRRMAMEGLLSRVDSRKAHPTFDHLLPVHVAAGAAEGEKAVQLWTLVETSLSWAQYRFGEVAA